jgi:hypothetical protein
MSEHKTNYMAELDAWTEDTILYPLFGTDPNQEDWEKTEAEVKYAIRQKVLESYKNGLRAGAGSVRREMDPHRAVSEGMQEGVDRFFAGRRSR